VNLSPAANASHSEDLYLDLLARALSASLYPESAWRRITKPRGVINRIFAKPLMRRGYILVRPEKFDAAKRDVGQDHPMIGYTMIGLQRLANIRRTVSSVVAADVAGDFVECGVWRGGASIYAKAVLKALGSDRTVWCCDSFEGMPVQKADDTVDPALAGSQYLIASLEEVQANFERFNLLDDRVRFVKGWFSDSLPTAPIEKISVLRLDGDYYSSTMDALSALYHKVSKGGFVIIDDYHSFKGCKQAVGEFRSEGGIVSELVPIDNRAVYWQV